MFMLFVVNMPVFLVLVAFVNEIYEITFRVALEIINKYSLGNGFILGTRIVNEFIPK